MGKFWIILSILYQGCFAHSFSSSFSSNWFVQRLDKSVHVSNPTLRFLFCCSSKEIKLKMKENAPIKIEIENSTKNACKLEVDADIIIRIKIYDCKVGWLWKKDFKLNINKEKCLKWRILSQPGRIGSGKKYLYFAYWAWRSPWGHVLSLITFHQIPVLNWAISMAFPVVEFSRQGYKIRKVFG